MGANAKAGTGNASGKLIDAPYDMGFKVDVGELLVLPEDHPRYDPRAGKTSDPKGCPGTPEFKAMVANVRTLGVKAPLIVSVVKGEQSYTSTRTGKPGHLAPGIYVLDGHQRRKWALAAAKALEAEGEGEAFTVPVRAERSRDEDYLASISLAANQRVEDSPLAIAEKLRAVAARFGGDVGKTAAHTGFPATFVKAHLALHDAVPEVRDAVQTGQMSVSAAAALAKEAPETQAKVMRQKPAPKAEDKKDGRRRNEVTVKDVKREVRQAKSDPEAPSRDVTEPPGKKEIRAMLKVANERGLWGVAKVLDWVLTGTGNPID